MSDPLNFDDLPPAPVDKAEAQEPFETCLALLVRMAEIASTYGKTAPQIPELRHKLSTLCRKLPQRQQVLLLSIGMLCSQAVTERAEKVETRRFFAEDL
jgi:hypothetical protein